MDDGTDHVLREQSISVSEHDTLDIHRPVVSAISLDDAFNDHLFDDHRDDTAPTSPPAQRQRAGIAGSVVALVCLALLAGQHFVPASRTTPVSAQRISTVSTTFVQSDIVILVNRVASYIRTQMLPVETIDQPIPAAAPTRNDNNVAGDNSKNPPPLMSNNPAPQPFAEDKREENRAKVREHSP